MSSYSSILADVLTQLDSLKKYIYSLIFLEQNFHSTSRRQPIGRLTKLSHRKPGLRQGLKSGLPRVQRFFY